MFQIITQSEVSYFIGIICIIPLNIYLEIYIYYKIDYEVIIYFLIVHLYIINLNIHFLFP